MVVVSRAVVGGEVERRRAGLLESWIAGGTQFLTGGTACYLLTTPHQGSGVWDHKDDECRELMKAKWTRQGLKVQ